MGDDVAAFVGEVPRFYDEGLGPVLFVPMADELAARVAAFSPGRVLEVAAGTGIASAALVRALPDAEVVVTDLNEPMLAIAAGRLPPGTVVQPADAQALPFPDHHFDAVVCQFGVMFLPDLATGLREARRVTRPGGRYVLSTWDHPRHNPYAEIAHTLVSEMFPDDTPPFYRVPYANHDTESLRRAVLGAGFHHVTVEVVPHMSRVERWEDFVGGFTRGNPVAAMVHQRGGDLGALQEAMLSAYTGAFGEAPTSMPVQAIFVTAS